MDVKALTYAVTVIEREIGGLRKEIEICRNNARESMNQGDPSGKAALLGTIKKELETCSFQLDEITAMLESLQKERLDADTFLAETTAFLKNNLRQFPPAGDQDFSASSISPLA